MNHIFKNTTKIVFGDNSLTELPTLLKEQQAYNPLLVYGRNSIKKNGIYDAIIKELTKINLKFEEFSGIESNPLHSTLNKAVAKAKEKKCDFILAIGGGSTIDAAKVIAASVNQKWNNCWDFVSQKVQLDHVPPLKVGAILTTASTGSESNPISVISNEETRQKLATTTFAPIFALINPKFTYSVNAWQSAAGGFDLFHRTLEFYVNAKPWDYADYFSFAVLKIVARNIPIILKDPRNYEARASILAVATSALSRTFQFRSAELGRDITVHQLEHILSASYNTTHGAGIALISPYFLRFAAQKSSKYHQKITTFGKEVFNTDDFESTMQTLENMIANWGLPRKYSDFPELKNVSKINFEQLISKRQWKENPLWSEEELTNILKSIKF